VNVRLKIPPKTNLIGLEWLVEDLSGNTFEIMDLKTNLKGFSVKDFRLDKDAMNISYTHIVNDNSRSSDLGSPYYIDLLVRIPNDKAQTEFVDVIQSSSLTGWNDKLDDVYDFAFEVSSVPVPKKISVNVFPNPVVNDLNIRINSGFTRNIYVDLFDGLGRKYYEESISIEPGRSLYRFPIGNLNTGIYFLQGSDENGILFS